MDAHDRLFLAKTPQDLLEASRDAVEKYLENRLIIDELEYFKQHHQLLGKHPIFSWIRRSDEIRGMKIGDLVNLKIRLENNLVRNRKKVRTAKNHPQTASRIERIKEMEKELIEVNRLLNL